MKKETLKTVGFPRSGNTFLNYSLKLLYYPEEDVNYCYHTTISLNKFLNVIVPLRNPLDSIASWHLLPYLSHGDINDHLRFYLRLSNAFLKNKEKCLFMDFDIFTKDVEYIKNKTNTFFNYNCDKMLSIEDIKDFINKNGFVDSLPRNNKDDLDKVKIDILDNKLYNNCENIYQELKKLL